MKLTGEFRRLTAAEERELALQRPREDPPKCKAFRAVARAGSPAWKAWLASDARRALIESNIPWAWASAVRAGGVGVGLRLGDDRFSVALMALCLAVDRFDPARGRLTNYVQKTVFLNIRRAEMREGHTIRVSGDVQEHISKLDRGLPVEPRRPGIVDDLPLARVALAAPLRDTGDGDGGAFWDTIPDLRGRASAGAAGASRMADRLLAAIDRLPPDQAAVVRLYHLSGDDRPTQREIAREAGVSRQAIQQRLDAAYARLRELLGEPGRDERPRSPGRPAT